MIENLQKRASKVNLFQKQWPVFLAGYIFLFDGLSVSREMESFRFRFKAAAHDCSKINSLVYRNIKWK